MKKTFTIAEFRSRFPTDDHCLNEIFRLRFGNEKECPKCGNDFNYTRVTTKSKKEGEQRKSFQCVSCGHQIYPLVGTIYEKTRTPLTYWFYSVYLMTATRNGVAAKELERQLGVTYKTAFRMAHRIRQLMKFERTSYLDGVIQIDEAFLGGATKNKHKKKRQWLRRHEQIFDRKIKVLGMLQNDKMAYAVRLNKISEKEILPLIVEHVKPGSVIVTDGAQHYDQLSELGFIHVVVNHKNNEWVKDGYHNNSIEGFWSQLKRTIKGTHIHISKKYANNYISECEFRYIHRKRQSEMFDIMLKKLA